jgi:hypothetical protein
MSLKNNIKDLEIKSNIEDNILFKQIKEQNKNLLEFNNKLQNDYKSLNNEITILKNKDIKDSKNIKTIYLSDSITIYKELDKPWQKMQVILHIINEDDNVNKNTYIEVIQWLNDKPSLKKHSNINKLSYHYKRKLNRIVEVYNKYKY